MPAPACARLATAQVQALARPPLLLRMPTHVRPLTKRATAALCRVRVMPVAVVKMPDHSTVAPARTVQPGPAWMVFVARARVAADAIVVVQRKLVVLLEHAYLFLLAKILVTPARV